MRGSTFIETLRRAWRSTIMWSAGFGAYGLVVVAVLPDPEGMKKMAEALTAVPAFVWQMVGVQDVSVLATTGGFIAFRYFLTASVLLAVWAVLTGMNITLNDESAGISNMVFSLPISRMRVQLEKFAAYLIPCAIIPLSGVVGLMAGMALNPHAATDLPPLVFSALVLVSVGMLIMCFTALIAVILPRKAWVASIAGGFVAVSFLFNSVGGMLRSDLGTAMQQFSVFHHSDASRVLLNGFPLVAVIVMLIVAGALMAASTRLFMNRDLAG